MVCNNVIKSNLFYKPDLDIGVIMNDRYSLWLFVLQAFGNLKRLWLYFYLCIYWWIAAVLFVCKYSIVLAESLCKYLYIQPLYKAIHSASCAYTGRFLSQAQHCDLMAVHLQKYFIFPKSLSVTCTLSFTPQM